MSGRLKNICARLHLYPYSDRGTFVFIRGNLRRGRAMKQGINMARVYRHMKSNDLHELRSRKLSRLRTLERRRGYLNDQEAARIQFNLRQLDAEIASREAQNRLFD